MLHKNYFYFFCLFFILYNCKDDVTVTFSETLVTTKNNELVEINIPKALEKNNISSEINLEISKTVINALHVGETDAINSNSIEESIDLFNKEYHAFNSDFPDIAQPWEAQIDGEVLFQSADIISISITSYVNTGGAHGITSISFLNFSASTGKRIKNEDLIINKKAFENIAKTYFNDALTEDTVLFEPNTFKLPENIGFNYEGVLLLYNQYEIAPYSTGIIDFVIPFEKVSSFLSFDNPN
ncbi:DUF3298 and DUF4163 domain-containing protein [Mariniflexile sp.]|uniref:DUF3298 and DUF4163 domain-containing protein n=1 Tax=Mariniflexile sp. TaxID=1979402 RepID=UPI0035672401